MIYTELNEREFINGMKKALDLNTPHGFTEAGLEALFAYLDDNPWDDTIEFDPISIMSDWMEYDSADEAHKELQLPLEELLVNCREVIKVGGGRVIVNNP